VLCVRMAAWVSRRVSAMKGPGCGRVAGQRCACAAALDMDMDLYV
jgi:hypothetical protein